LELPITVKEGSIGEILLNVPWTSLDKNQSSVRLKNLFLLICPKMEPEGSTSDIIERSYNTKKRSLEIAEALGLDNPTDDKKSQTDDKKKVGFFEGIGMKIIDNLQVFIDDIHIRFEDPIHNLSLGITISYLHVQSVNEKWEPGIIGTGQKILRKLADLRNLAVYLNCGTDFIQYSNQRDFVNKMSSYIYKD